MFPTALSEAARLTQARLAAAMADLGDLPVVQAMRYAVEGGKGLRGFLVLEGARLHGVPAARAVHAAAAIEAIHAYSLVHDDLPCMDDDALRRGQPTVHIAWDEATAVLAGDALQALAFEMLVEAGPPDLIVPLVRSLAQAGGAAGMVGGQALDIAAETAEAPLTLAQIVALQDRKTGALIRWAGCAGPMLAGEDPAAMAAFSGALGLAFQIADDILDVEGDAEKAGKRLQKDAQAGKATFVSLLGLDGARTRARDLVTEAEAALAPYGPEAETLRQAARFVISRDF
jgi:farnesyl diphosphate synthase